MDMRLVSSSTNSVTRLIVNLRSEDPGLSDEAARRIWERYLPRLLTLARGRLDPRIRLRHDEEDVVQSMGRSFFRRVRRGDFDLADRDALWALLLTITLNKARKAADHHLAERRDARRVQALSRTERRRPGVVHEVCALEAHDPTPETAAILNEALEQRLRNLPEPDLRRIALMKLEGYTNHEIAEALGCSGRSVERKLNLIRKRWDEAC